MSPSDPTRVLALVSHDFGELANTANFLAGVPVHARLLLPPRLQALNPVMAPHEVAPLGDRDAVLAELARLRPQLLLLMSGYLLAFNRLLSAADLAAILDEARRLGTRVATTDPFLGVWQGPQAHRHPSQGEGAQALAEVAALLGEAGHLYPAPMTTAPGQHAWFNETAHVPAGAMPALAELLSQAPTGLTLPFWLLVLSAEDFRMQSQLQGRAAFEAQLLALAAAAASQGRRLVGLMPDMACESLRQLDGGLGLWLAFCDHARFRALVLCAEHAFYWNRLSNSVLTRLAHERSAFFFSEGHLSQVLPQVGALARASHFAGAPTPLLAPGASLEAQDLATLARLQHQDLAPARAALRALPGPSEVIERLLEGATA